MTQGIEFFRPKTKQPQEEVRVCGYYRQHDFFFGPHQASFLLRPDLPSNHDPENNRLVQTKPSEKY